MIYLCTSQTMIRAIRSAKYCMKLSLGMNITTDSFLSCHRFTFTSDLQINMSSFKLYYSVINCID